MADRIAKLYRLINGGYSSLDASGLADVVVTLNNGSGAAITRRDSGATILPSQSAPIPASSPGVWEYNHTALNLDLAYEYDIWFRIFDASTGEFDSQPVIIGSELDSDSLAVLRRRVGRLMLGRSRFAYGPILASDTNSITVNFVRRFSDGHFNGRNAFIVDGLGAGQEAFITSSIRGSGQLSVEPTWETLPNVGSYVEVWGDGLGIEDVNAAINMAIADVAKVYYIRETVPILASDFSSDRYSVPLPDQFDFVSGFRYQRPQIPEWLNYSERDSYRPFELHDGRLYITSPIPTDVTSGFLDGYRRVRQLRSDADVSDVPSAFVVFFAAFQLEAGDAAGQSLDPEQHSGRAGNWLRQALIERGELFTRWLPNTVAI